MIQCKNLIGKKQKKPKKNKKGVARVLKFDYALASKQASKQAVC